MDDDVKVLERIYDRFNARDIDGVLSALADDVAWANGMDGGHVHGREAVRAYWTRQWTMVSPHVEPVSFHRTQDGAIIAEVRQSVRDLEGKPLQGQTHGPQRQDSRPHFPFSRRQSGSLRHRGCCLGDEAMRRSKARLHAETIRFASSVRTRGATIVPRSSIERRIASCGWSPTDICMRVRS